MTNEHSSAPVLDLFRKIQSDFSGLTTRLSAEHDQVDIMLEIPQQPGLAFAVNLYLDGDELHLCAGDFWSIWFPSGITALREEYREAVMGLLNGDYRIVEHFLGTVSVKRELQKPVENGWTTVYTQGGLMDWIPWPRGVRVMRNGGISPPP